MRFDVYLRNYFSDHHFVNSYTLHSYICVQIVDKLQPADMPQVILFLQYACYPDLDAKTQAIQSDLPRMPKYRALSAWLRTVYSTSSANDPSISNRLAIGVLSLCGHKKTPAGRCPESEEKIKQNK